jgi:protein-tyrosine phosphatase
MLPSHQAWDKLISGYALPSPFSARKLLGMAGIMGSTDDFVLGRAFAFTNHEDSYRFCHALEDLPADARAQATEIASLPPGLSLRRKIFDELENAALDSYGELERVRLLHFLADYPVTPYTYNVSPVMSRGQRPTARKLADLVRRGHYRATVNLCAEMTGGDGPLIEQAGLAGELATYHIPVVDMWPPTVAQVIALLDLLTGPQAGRTYLHCEAGQGRTGVAVACYRMAVMGWSAADALTEAKNFGCSVPMQQAFIDAFGLRLQRKDPAREPDLALGRYPLKPPGSVGASIEELTVTRASCARLEAGEP